MLNLRAQDTIELFADKYVDFYLEDDMFELEGEFFQDEEGALYIEVLDAVGHILEMAGKELKVWQDGAIPTATRPDGHQFLMEVNRVYYKMENPTPADFIEMYEKTGITKFFLKLTDIMVDYNPEEKTWKIVRDKVNMIYIGNIKEYDSIEALFEDNADVMEGLWQAVCYEAYEEESDYTVLI